MNILLISTWWPLRPSNGAEIRAHHLLRALARKHNVTLVAFDHGLEEDAVADVANGMTPVEVVRVVADPFRYVALPQWLKFVSPIPLAFWPSREMQRALAPLRNRAWDAVVGLQPMSARYVAGFDAPKVIDVDTALSFQMLERYCAQHDLLPRWRAWLSYRKARAAEGHWLGQAQACTVVSDGELPYLAKLLGRRVPYLAVCANGVDCRANAPGLVPKRPRSLIYNGAMTYDANFDAMFYFLLEIYPRIQGFVPDVSMTVTGSTRNVHLDRLSLQESVVLSGFVDDIRPLVAGSTVCVVPLRKGGGTRLKILEAMALGTPVVSTAKGAEGLDVRDGEHLLIADDPQTFAECTVRLLLEEDLRERLTRNARLLMEQQYDWEIIGQQFVSWVERAVQERRMPGRAR